MPDQRIVSKKMAAKIDAYRGRYANPSAATLARYRRQAVSEAEARNQLRLPLKFEEPEQQKEGDQ